MFSVVIPLYNKEKQIANTLHSVLTQTCQDFEVVIVDDGSTDNSVAEVRKIQDPRIRLVSQKNAGVSAARNRGISEARGEYIAFLDADDEWKPDYLKAINELIDEYPDCDVFTTRYQFIDESGNASPAIMRGIDTNRPHFKMDNYFHVASNSNPPICSSSVAINRAAILSIGGFPVGVICGEDLLTWAKLAIKFKIAVSNRILAIYFTPSTGPVRDEPSDIQSTDDFVGNQLRNLLSEYPESGIQEYIAFWYKMRARINIGMRNRKATIKCSCKSLRYNPKQIKPWVFMALAISPDVLIRKILLSV